MGLTRSSWKISRRCCSSMRRNWPTTTRRCRKTTVCRRCSDGVKGWVVGCGLWVAGLWVAGLIRRDEVSGGVFASGAERRRMDRAVFPGLCVQMVAGGRFRLRNVERSYPKSHAMSDTSITKVSSEFSPTGELGQKYLASGKSARDASVGKRTARRTVARSRARVRDGRIRDQRKGGVAHRRPDAACSIAAIRGRCPKGPSTRTRFWRRLTAVEATSPPAQVHDRDHA